MAKWYGRTPMPGAARFDDAYQRLAKRLAEGLVAIDGNGNDFVKAQTEQLRSDRMASHHHWANGESMLALWHLWMLCKRLKPIVG